MVSSTGKPEAHFERIVEAYSLQDGALLQFLRELWLNDRIDYWVGVDDIPPVKTIDQLIPLELVQAKWGLYAGVAQLGKYSPEVQAEIKAAWLCGIQTGRLERETFESAE